MQLKHVDRFSDCIRICSAYSTSRFQNTRSKFAKKMWESKKLSEPDFKARIKLLCQSNKISEAYYSEKELSQAFQDLVSWCVNNEVDKFKRAFEDVSRPIFKDLVFFIKCVDETTGYNIHEIVVIMESVEIP